MITLTKPEIRYVDLGNCRKGESADVCLRAGEHPHEYRFGALPGTDGGTIWVKTSAVLGFIRHTFNGPVFETRNSIYLPYPADAPGELHTVKANNVKAVSKVKQ